MNAKGCLYLLGLVLLVLASVSDGRSLRKIYNERVKTLQKMARPMKGFPKWIKHEGVV